MKYERETCNLLRRLGVNNSYVGFRYTVYGVIRAIANPELLIYISKGLYVEISAEYHTSIGCVERNIRTIISTIWLHGDRTLLNQVFGFELEQKPRNGAFIDALSHYVVEHYYDCFCKIYLGYPSAYSKGIILQNHKKRREGRPGDHRVCLLRSYIVSF